MPGRVEKVSGRAEAAHGLAGRLLERAGGARAALALRSGALKAADVALPALRHAGAILERAGRAVVAGSGALRGAKCALSAGRARNGASNATERPARAVAARGRALARLRATIVGKRGEWLHKIEGQTVFSYIARDKVDIRLQTCIA